MLERKSAGADTRFRDWRSERGLRGEASCLDLSGACGMCHSSTYVAPILTGNLSFSLPYRSPRYPWRWPDCGIGQERSSLLAMLMHAAINNSKDIVPSAVPGGTDTFGLSASLTGWITVALLWVFEKLRAQRHAVISNSDCGSASRAVVVSNHSRLRSRSRIVMQSIGLGGEQTSGNAAANLDLVVL
jgi:hypothetical protein